MFNFQKSKLCIALLALSAASYIPQAMSFDLGGIGGGGKSASASAGDPDAFIKTAKSAEDLMNNSVTLLVRSLASKEDAAKYEDRMKDANAETNPKEKEAKILEAQKIGTAALNETLSNNKFKDDIKKMNSKQKEELGASAFNFMLALLQDKALSEQASGLISSLSGNPMNLSKLGSVKDVASSLSNQISSASKIATKMPDIFSAVGVKPPATKDEKQKTTADTGGKE